MRLMKKLLALVFALVAMGQIYADMLPDVWILRGGRPHFRTGITKDSPQGADWVVVDLPGREKAQWVSVGPNGQVWVIGAAIPERAPDGPLYYRVGVTPTSPMGTSWAKIDGFAVCVAVSNNFVIHTNRLGEIYASPAITDANLNATWKKVDGTIKFISINKDDIVWGIQAPDKIYVWDKPFAAADFNSTPWASHWKPVAGGLSQLSVGPDIDGNRLVWGTGSDYATFYRVGVTTAVPGGTEWRREIGSIHRISIAPYPVKMSSQSTHSGGMVWGVNQYGNIYYKKDATAGDYRRNWLPLAGSGAGSASHISVGGIEDPVSFVTAAAAEKAAAEKAAAEKAAADKAAADKAAADKAAADKAAADKAAADKAAADKAAADKAAADKAAADKAAADKAAADAAAAQAAADKAAAQAAADKAAADKAAAEAALTPAAKNIEVIKAINQVPNIVTKIKSLYTLMQQAAGQQFDAQTQSTFAEALVNAFNDARTSDSYMQQTLQAAAKSSLLNADQQKYVTQTMIPMFAGTTAQAAAPSPTQVVPVSAAPVSAVTTSVPVAKTTAVVKPVTTVAKKTVAKKTVAKKPVAKKPVAKKAVKKVVKKVVKKKAAAKKTAPGTLSAVK
ncbi:MAG: tectonin domain-containing protein [bacterium]